MTTPVAHSASDTARLMVGAPGFAVGWQQQVILPPPAAGLAWSRKVPGSFLERLLAVSFTLTTSAAVANRVTAVQLVDNNGVVIASVPAGGAQVASTGLVVSLTTGAPAYAAAAAGASAGFLPDILVPPDWAWQAVVAGIDVADQFSRVVLLVQQFPNDAAAISATG